MNSGAPDVSAGLVDGYWLRVRDMDPRVTAIYRRHYSANLRKDHSRGIGGPGDRVVLLTMCCRALFVWRHRERGESTTARGYDDGQRGVMCAVFRNEGAGLSSELIREADEIAWRRWPGERHFTYVKDAAVASPNPGYCFKQAGWRTCGRNADGRLTILERLPT